MEIPEILGGKVRGSATVSTRPIGLTSRRVCAVSGAYCVDTPCSGDEVRFCERRQNSAGFEVVSHLQKGTVYRSATGDEGRGSMAVRRFDKARGKRGRFQFGLRTQLITVLALG